MNLIAFPHLPIETPSSGGARHDGGANGSALPAGQPRCGRARLARCGHKLLRPLPREVLRDALLVWETVDLFGTKGWNWLKLAPVGFDTHLQLWTAGPLGRTKFHRAYLRSEAVSSWEHARDLVIAWTSTSGPELSDATLGSMKQSFDGILSGYMRGSTSGPSALRT